MAFLPRETVVFIGDRGIITKDRPGQQARGAMACTYDGCTAAQKCSVWIDNLTWYSVDLGLCPEHWRVLLDTLAPFMRPDDRRDVRREAQETEEMWKAEETAP